jgi:hypothetical protein
MNDDARNHEREDGLWCSRIGCLRRFGPKRHEVTGKWGRRITRNYMICTPHQIPFGWSNEEYWVWRGRWQVWETGEVHTGFWWGDVREIDHLEDLGVWRECNITIDFQESVMEEAWIGFIWLRIGTESGRLWMRQWTFGFRKICVISGPAENWIASQEGPCSVELFICLSLYVAS